MVALGGFDDVSVARDEKESAVKMNAQKMVLFMMFLDL